jgi:hypothetical protein
MNASAFTAQLFGRSQRLKFLSFSGLKQVRNSEKCSKTLMERSSHNKTDLRRKPFLRKSQVKSSKSFEKNKKVKVMTLTLSFGSKLELE